jgi:prepilin-type processing-associated H-X9-DG protein
MTVAQMQAKRVNVPGNPLNPAASPNVRLRGTQISVLMCPSDAFNKQLYNGLAGSAHNPPTGNYARGNYGANAGRMYIFGGGGGDKARSPDSPAWLDQCNRGVMGPNVGVKIKQISDGMSSTIMIGEVRAGITDQDSRGVWSLGGPGSSMLAKYGSNGDDNGPNNCFPHGDDIITDTVDQGGGTINCLKATTSPGGAECMTAHGGTANMQAGPRSMHPGGLHIAMCDGSVQFVSDDIETTGCYAKCCALWDRMIASADGGKPGDATAANGCY